MKKVLKIIIIVASILLVVDLAVLSGLYLYQKNNNDQMASADSELKEEPQEEINQEILQQEEDPIKTVTISAVGDCTIGWDTRYNPARTFNTYLEKNDGDYGYYFAEVKDIFEEDDLTIVNLEGTFTEHKTKVPKSYNFSAPQDYKNVLSLGGVDVVSFANNHTHDFGEIGYEDTLEALESIDMPYYGYENYLVKEVNGIKIGFFAFYLLSVKNKNLFSFEKSDDVSTSVQKFGWFSSSVFIVVYFVIVFLEILIAQISA